MTERDRLYFQKQMGAIMDTARPTERESEEVGAVCINIHFPGSVHIAGCRAVEINVWPMPEERAAAAREASEIVREAIDGERRARK